MFQTHRRWCSWSVFTAGTDMFVWLSHEVMATVVLLPNHHQVLQIKLNTQFVWAENGTVGVYHQDHLSLVPELSHGSFSLSLTYKNYFLWICDYKQPQFLYMMIQENQDSQWLFEWSSRPQDSDCAELSLWSRLLCYYMNRNPVGPL